METSVVKDSFTEKVDCQVKNVNKTEGDFLMTLHEKLQNERAEGVAEGRKQGIEQGKIKGAIEKQNSLIKRMFEKNMTTEEIADITCLPTEEIQKILDSIHK